MRIVFGCKTNEDKFFLVSFYVYFILAFLPFMKTLPVAYIQMPIMLFSYSLLLISSARYMGRRFASMVVVCTIGIILFNYLLIYLQSDYSGATLINKIGANYSLFVTSFPLLLVFSHGFERVDKKRLCNVVLFAVFIICITTIIGTYRFESPCRELATPYNPELNRTYLRNGIGGYGFIYFLVLFCQIVIRELRKKFSLYKLIMLLTMVFCVIRSEYTMAIVIMLISIIVSILLHRGNFISGAITVAAGGIILINFENILKWGISIFENASLYITLRLKSILQFYQNESISGDLLLRQKTYALSIEAFFENPIFGRFFKTGAKVGGHSEILDLAGHAGIIGLIILAVVIWWIYKYTPLGNIKFDVHLKIMFAVSIILAVINTFSAPELLFAVFAVPVMFSSEYKILNTNPDGEEKSPG